MIYNSSLYHCVLSDKKLITLSLSILTLFFCVIAPANWGRERGTKWWCNALNWRYYGSSKNELSFQIVFCTLSQLAEVDMGEPLHSLIIPGETHPVEDEMLATFTRRWVREWESDLLSSLHCIIPLSIVPYKGSIPPSNPSSQLRSSLLSLSPLSPHPPSFPLLTPLLSVLLVPNRVQSFLNPIHSFKLLFPVISDYFLFLASSSPPFIYIYL